MSAAHKVFLEGQVRRRSQVDSAPIEYEVPCQAGTREWPSLRKHRPVADDAATGVLDKGLRWEIR